jgi:uncharacterized protein
MVATVVEPRPTTIRCPTCRTAVGWADNPFRPFCSERCRIVDLGNWASDRYRVPGEHVSEDDDTSNGTE